ncbi:pentatricopeptide repeat-containing protein At5g66520-like [Magnolia sinica]|uniref:pentatricopeptide repeat-containing protein At5g66520-like n=1 Tax=Magnolia sinica TaxID=86752 RepID=UPI00265B290F|nr:pentatricopeptide repeat-containing protein At5g66520-like [Magnolia sinica]
MPFSLPMATMSATSLDPIPCTPPPQNPAISFKTITRILDTNCYNSPQHLKQTHSQIIKSGLFQDNYIAGSLIKCYTASNSSSLDIALRIFNQVKGPHAFLWNSIIRAFLDKNAPENSILFYSKMVAEQSKPNKYTYPSLLKACTTAGAVEEGVQVHAHVIKHGLGGDGYIQSAGIQMYASFGRVSDARRLFDDSGAPDAVSWNAMIDGYFRFGDADAAAVLFEQMPCRNVSSWNAMVSGYARCGRVEDSRQLFDEMSERDEISWSAMIDGYVQCGCFKEALGVFHEMQRRGIRLRKFLFSSVLAACANVGALDQGRWIHAYIERNSMKLDAVLGTALVDMYAKCGRLEMALEVFNQMQRREVFEWNAMIGGLAMHGHANEAIELFSRMQADMVRPDKITFVGVLSACAHAGLVEEGQQYFNSMKHVFGVEPTVEHYGCLVDLLGRAGLLDEAESVIQRMWMKPNAAIWGALLGACRIHGNVELGERVGKILLELEPHNSGRYTLLSNIYAKAGRWDDVANVRKLMKARGIKTTPGSSLIDVDGIIHEFVMGDGSHPQMNEIRSMLEEIVERLRLEGYVLNTAEVLFNIDEEEKESALCQHSEKLAIAFGFLNTAPGTTIRIVKNLRVCEDCHSATKLISRVYGREIVVRDRVRYHRFKDGMCSCTDFW